MACVMAQPGNDSCEGNGYTHAHTLYIHIHTHTYVYICLCFGLAKKCLHFFNLIFYLFIFIFLAALGLSCMWTLRCGVRASLYLVVACRFSLSSCDMRASECMGSVVVVHGLQSTWAL